MPFNPSGRKWWVIGFNDGTLRLYSRDGSKGALHNTGQRLRALVAIGDLIVAATHRGLTAWRLVPEQAAMLE